MIKEPVWSVEIPLYLMAGGLAGASAGLAYLAGLRGDRQLARRAWINSFAAVSVSPVLLIKDLGRPRRFLNMLRLFKVSSPMSVGSWILTVAGSAITVATANELSGRLRLLARVCRPVAALFGLPLSTYTGALLADTAVPAWHGSRRELPLLFACGAAAGAGAAAAVVTPLEEAAPARRLAVLGGAGELLCTVAIEQRLGELAEPYNTGVGGRYGRASRALTIAGVTLLATVGHRSRPAAAVGGAAVLAGALAARFSIFRGGFQSARDPKYTVEPQRRRLAARVAAP